MDKTTFQRRKHCCPHCGKVIDDSYISMNPFPEIPCPSCSRLVNASALLAVVQNAENERAAPRCPASLKVAYESFNEFITEYTRNVSQGGMFISTKRKHQIGEIVVLALTVPGIDHPLRITGEIVRVSLEMTSPEGAGIGIKFSDMDAESRQMLVNYIRSLDNRC
ncbi:MAG: hypothetical protein OHK006_01220 [Thermodesulfovibrionales bacterium]